MNCPECSNPLELRFRDWPAEMAELLGTPHPEWWVIKKICWECGWNTAYHTPLLIRPVTMHDAKLIYDWRMDEQSRQMSFDTTVFTYEEHEEWMRRFLQLTYPSPLLWWIGEIEGVPVGTVRLTPSRPSTVSVIVNPDYRGYGIAARLLQACPIPEGTLAHVKASNIASQQSFQVAGWQSQETVYGK